MNKKQARDAARQILEDEEPGTEIFLTTTSMASNPHTSSGKGHHVDGYRAEVGPGGGVSVTKDSAPAD